MTSDGKRARPFDPEASVPNRQQYMDVVGHPAFHRSTPTGVIEHRCLCGRIRRQGLLIEVCVTCWDSVFDGQLEGVEVPPLSLAPARPRAYAFRELLMQSPNGHTSSCGACNS